MGTVVKLNLEEESIKKDLIVDVDFEDISNKKKLNYDGIAIFCFNLFLLLMTLFFLLCMFCNIFDNKNLAPWFGMGFVFFTAFFLMSCLASTTNKNDFFY